MTESRIRKVSEAARVYQLGAAPSDDISATSTPAERIEMVAILTRRAWELTGKPWPSIARSAWPTTIVRPR